MAGACCGEILDKLEQIAKREGAGGGARPCDLCLSGKVCRVCVRMRLYCCAALPLSVCDLLIDTSPANLQSRNHVFGLEKKAEGDGGQSAAGVHMTAKSVPQRRRLELHTQQPTLISPHRCWILAVREWEELRISGWMGVTSCPCG